MFSYKKKYTLTETKIGNLKLVIIDSQTLTRIYINTSTAAKLATGRKAKSLTSYKMALSCDRKTKLPVDSSRKMTSSVMNR